MKKIKLIPPDKKQCQAEKPNGVNAFTLGGKFELIRCENEPIFIAKEKRPGKDGRRGSMSLCGSCKKKMEEQMPGVATFTEIKLRKKKTKKKKNIGDVLMF